MDIFFIISVIGFLVSMLLGYLIPRKYGWFLILTIPILSAGRLLLIPSSLFPLKYTIFALGGTIGIYMALKTNISNITTNFRNVKYWLFFYWFMLIILFVKSFPNDIRPIFSEDFSMFFIGIFLPLLIIKSESDVYLIFKILVWQGVIISIIAILEFYGIANFQEMLKKTNPSYDSLDLYIRAQNLRVLGIDGNSVNTATRMSILFFISLWYIIQNRKVWTVVPVALISISLIMFQTRSAFVSVFLSLVIILLLSVLFDKMRNLKLNKIIGVVLVMFIVITTIPTIEQLSTDFSQFFVDSITGQEKTTEGKINRIPFALSLIKDKPIFGYGSPKYCYYQLMYTEDVPVPFLYLLSGGIILLTLFLIVYIYPIFIIISFLKDKKSTFVDKTTMIYGITAWSAGFIAMFSNWILTQRIIMFFIFATLIKLQYLYNQKKT